MLEQLEHELFSLVVVLEEISFQKKHVIGELVNEEPPVDVRETTHSVVVSGEDSGCSLAFVNERDFSEMIACRDQLIQDTDGSRLVFDKDTAVSFGEKEHVEAFVPLSDDLLLGHRQASSQFRNQRLEEIIFAE